jgi:hypothetical protein
MKPTFVFMLVGLGGAVALGGCVDHQPGVTGVQSLKVELVTPASPGSVTNRLPDTAAARMISVSISSYDADGNPDTTLTTDLQVYAQYLGTLTPALGATMPLGTIHLAAGVAKNQAITLPNNVLGPATLWIEDGKGAHPSFATGASPTLWYREPLINDIQSPANGETAIDALASSRLANKNVNINGSIYGASGRLVVTSVFASGYTVSDVKCADAAGSPPCTAEPYNAVEVFSFSAPRDQDGGHIVEGQVISGFAGGVSLFNGLIEIGFPQTFVADSANPDINPAREPKPTKVITPDWFGPLSNSAPTPGGGVINFKRWQATPIEIDNVKICPTDADYNTYKQWKVDPSQTCTGNLINVVTAGTLTFDPVANVGKVLPKLVGVLRPISIGSFNVWIIYPRSAADLGM